MTQSQSACPSRSMPSAPAAASAGPCPASYGVPVPTMTTEA
jgi:hypothetical protein